MENKLRPIIGVLRRLRPDRKVSNADFPNDTAALLLRKSIAPKRSGYLRAYAAEYLWNGQTTLLRRQ